MIQFGRIEIWLAAMLLFAAAVIAETAAIAQGASPLTFLEQVYKVYRDNNNAKGIDYSKPDNVRRYFAPPLAKAILKDMADARKKDEVPRLNGDPFIDAQDWEIANLKIEMKPGATRRNATGVVTFTNSKRAEDGDARPSQDRRRLAHRRDQGAERLAARAATRSNRV